MVVVALSSAEPGLRGRGFGAVLNWPDGDKSKGDSSGTLPPDEPNFSYAVRSEKSGRHSPVGYWASAEGVYQIPGRRRYFTR